MNDEWIYMSSYLTLKGENIFSEMTKKEIRDSTCEKKS